MAHINKVIRSINLHGADICVDVFMRPDGTYGFDEFRRDPEDTRGWYSVGHFSDRVFVDDVKALADAQKMVGWLPAQLEQDLKT